MKKRLVSILLMLIMICSFAVVSAEITTEYHQVAATGETILKVSKCAEEDRFDADSENPLTIIGMTNSPVSFNTNDYVIFRAKIETKGVYKLSLGVATASGNETSSNYAISINDGDETTISAVGGLGWYEPNYDNEIFIKVLEAGDYAVKVKSVNASVHLMGVKFEGLGSELTVKDVKANGVSVIEYPYVNVNTQSLTVDLSMDVDAQTVNSSTVMLTYAEKEQDNIAISEVKTEGTVITVIPSSLIAGAEYTLTINGVADNYGLSTITETKYVFTAFEGSVAKLKYNDLVFEAEDFTEAGYFSGSDVIDQAAVEIRTNDDVTYVEFDNNDYIRIPVSIPKNAQYSICVVYAASSGASVSVGGTYQLSFPQTSDMETYSTFEPGVSSELYSAYTTSIYVRPTAMEVGEKFRVDKIILTRGMAIPADGTVSVRRITSDRDGQSDDFAYANSTGTPSTLNNGMWAEYVYYFPESGYYNIQTRTSTYKGNALNFVLSFDEKEAATKYFVLKEGTGNYATGSSIGGYDIVSPLDLGTYYFEKGHHIIKLSQTIEIYTYAFDILIQRTDLIDGTVAYAVDATNDYAVGATDYTKGLTPYTITELAAGQYMSFSVTAEETGYYSLNAMLSNANGEVVPVTITIDDTEYTHSVKKISKNNTSINDSSINKIIQMQKIADVYLTEGTHTVKIAVPEDGSVIGVNSVGIYKPEVTYAGPAEGTNDAEVRLNGLYSGKEASAALAIYKEKDGVRQLAKIDYDATSSAINGTRFDLSASDIAFEDGYTYTAKVLVWNNMSGDAFEYGIE